MYMYKHIYMFICIHTHIPTNSCIQICVYVYKKYCHQCLSPHSISHMQSFTHTLATNYTTRQQLLNMSVPPFNESCAAKTHRRHRTYVNIVRDS